MVVITAPKKSDYIRTFTGIKFWPLDPSVKDIKPADIAHALAQKVRWQGHCKHFYSVGQHSLRVARAARIYGTLEGLPEEECDLLYMYGILHDSNEAYLPDIPTPLKPLIKGWKRIEKHLDSIILKRFGLPTMSVEHKRLVKKADKALLQMEADELFERSNKDKHTHWPLPERLDIPEEILLSVHVKLFPPESSESQLNTEMNTILRITSR